MISLTPYIVIVLMVMLALGRRVVMSTSKLVGITGWELYSSKDLKPNDPILKLVIEGGIHRKKLNITEASLDASVNLPILDAPIAPRNKGRLKEKADLLRYPVASTELSDGARKMLLAIVGHIAPRLLHPAKVRELFTESEENLPLIQGGGVSSIMGAVKITGY
jgi:hypothetical protein